MERDRPRQSIAGARPGVPGLLVALAILLAAGSRVPLFARPGMSAATLAASSGFAGTVFDSVHDGPLIGAVVSVLGTPRRSITDEQGRYRIDSVAPGSYKLGLAHALLDTLGLDLTTRVIEVPAGRYVVITLATPSPRSIRALICPGQDTLASPSLLLGRVRDADTDAPATGTKVSLVYPELHASKETGLTRPLRVRWATVESDGTYAICGLPSEVHGKLRAERSGATTAEIETVLENQVIALRSMTIGTGTVAAIANSSRASARAAIIDSARVARDTIVASAIVQSGNASVSGRVVDSLEMPIAGVQLTVTGTAVSATSGTNGEFTLTSLPSGTRELVARRVGLASVSMLVELTRRDTRRVTVRLTQRAFSTLTPVVVEAKVDIGLAHVGFVDRKKRSTAGHFITPDDITRMRPREASDLLVGVPGLQLMTSNGRRVIMARRSVVGQASACVNVFFDGMQWQSRTPGDFDVSFPVADIGAMETYPGSAVPHEFVVPGMSCSTIVIWSKLKIGMR